MRSARFVAELTSHYGPDVDEAARHLERDLHTLSGATVSAALDTLEAAQIYVNTLRPGPERQAAIDHVRDSARKCRRLGAPEREISRRAGGYL